MRAPMAAAARGRVARPSCTRRRRLSCRCRCPRATTSSLRASWPRRPRPSREPRRAYELAGRLMAEAAEAEPSAAAALRKVAARTGREQASGSSLTEALTGRGYEPYEDEDGAIRLRNCPFHRLAAEHRDLVCGMNHAFLEGFLEGLDRDDVTAELDPHPGRCCVAIRPR